MSEIWMLLNSDFSTKQDRFGKKLYKDGLGFFRFRPFLWQLGNLAVWNPNLFTFWHFAVVLCVHMRRQFSGQALKTGSFSGFKILALNFNVQWGIQNPDWSSFSNFQSYFGCWMVQMFRTQLKMKPFSQQFQSSARSRLTWLLD